MRLSNVRSNKLRVVAVSGGFDPIHEGHIEYLKAAAKLGYPERVVVILNSDRFLKKKKGKAFMSLKERKKILEAIKYVDSVFISIDKDQTVGASLERLRPDIFAKGGDRNIKNIPQDEIDVCRKYGIKMKFGVGGKKVQSSSWLLNNYVQDVQTKENHIRRGRSSDRSR